MKCYISAPANFDLTKIESILDNLAIRHHSFYDYSIGTTFADLIRRKIRESDFVIAVLNREAENVLFEIGVAEGLKKETFILLDKELKAPFFLDTKLYFQTNFKEYALIELALKNFRQDLLLNRRPAQQKSDKDFLSVNDASDALMKIQALRRGPKEKEIFKLIKDTFSRLDVQNVSIDESLQDNAVDLIIKSKNLSPYFGNPIFVEVKTGRLSKKKILDAEQKLSYYIEKTDAKAGILLYLDIDNKRFDNNLTIYNSILLFDLEDFFNGIASDGFEKTLLEKRNKSVHGNQ